MQGAIDKVLQSCNNSFELITEHAKSYLIVNGIKRNLLIYKHADLKNTQYLSRVICTLMTCAKASIAFERLCETIIYIFGSEVESRFDTKLEVCRTVVQLLLVCMYAM